MIEWTISQPRRLVSATVVGRALPEHFEAYIVAVDAAGAAPYRKLFRVMTADAVDPRDIPAIAAVVVKHGRSAAKVGPVAIVVNSRESNLLADWFKSLASLERPVRIFQQEGAALAWLDGIAPPPAST
ncbi:MAG: hypothetical protein KF889_17945 [Alphaproteobacteria bacterium]|nr:hypothetical protein [Alphaproteobacteria bacterium]MCW5741336.1 hypothetical protein [Alphaproteobacteria bacterium]